MELFGKDDIMVFTKLWPYNLIYDVAHENFNVCPEFSNVKTFGIDKINVYEFGMTLELLDERKRQILVLYYKDGINMSKIAEKLSISREAVRQLKCKGINCLGYYWKKYVSVPIEAFEKMKNKNNELQLDNRILLLQNAALRNDDLPDFKTEIENINIKALTFSTRAMNALTAIGIETIGDITKLNIFQLIKIRNIGIGCIKEILSKLYSYNLKLTKCSKFDEDHIFYQSEPILFYEDLFNESPFYDDEKED